MMVSLISVLEFLTAIIFFVFIIQNIRPYISNNFLKILRYVEIKKSGVKLDKDLKHNALKSFFIWLGAYVLIIGIAYIMIQNFFIKYEFHGINGRWIALAIIIIYHILPKKYRIELSDLNYYNKKKEEKV